MTGNNKSYEVSVLLRPVQVVPRNLRFENLTWTFPLQSITGRLSHVYNIYDIRTPTKSKNDARTNSRFVETDLYPFPTPKRLDENFAFVFVHILLNATRSHFST